MKKLMIIFAFFFFSCSNDVPNPASEDIFDNPLDEEEVEYDLPALTFYPVEVDVAAGTSFGVDVFALGFFLRRLFKMWKYSCKIKNN